MRKMRNNKVMGERLSRYMKAPLRLLIKARDLYIKGMSEWSHRGAGTFMAWPAAHVTALPRSSSSRGVDKDLRDQLIRTRRFGNYNYDHDDHVINGIINSSDFPRKLHHHHPLARSSSVGIGRIDEDKPCEFGRDSSMLRTDDHQHLFKRSRSYACATRR